jgi:hypothetical protein
MTYCLSEPCEVIQQIFYNKTLYENVINSIQLSRNARSLGGMYCLYFCNPCDNSSITLRGERILYIYDNPCNVVWCNNTERVAGLTILNSEFFAEVLLSYTEALRAKNEVREYCKSFKIPRCLFPNISQNRITISGDNIIKLMNRSLNSYCK